MISKPMACGPQNIDMVVMTHLHRDHVGWNLLTQGDKYTPTFPNARYWMSAIDWEACHRPDVRDSFSQCPYVCLAPGRFGAGRVHAWRTP